MSQCSSGNSRSDCRSMECMLGIAPAIPGVTLQQRLSVRTSMPSEDPSR
jgi:hypothetical protein